MNEMHMAPDHNLFQCSHPTCQRDAQEAAQRQAEIKSLADLRPGDIMFGPIGGLVGLGVGLGQIMLGEGVRIGKLSVRHVGVVVQAAHPTISLDDGREHFLPPKLAQAMPGGAEIIDMFVDTHWTDRHAYVRLPEDYPGQAADAAAIARLMVDEGVSYSFASYAALAAWRWGLKTPRLEKWIGRRRELTPWPTSTLSSPTVRRQLEGVRLPCEAICSVFADQAWTLAGKCVMQGTRPQVVTPGALAMQLWRRPGVVWAGPGLL